MRKGMPLKRPSSKIWPRSRILYLINIPSASPQQQTSSPHAPFHGGYCGLGWEERAKVWLIVGWEATSRASTVPKGERIVTCRHQWLQIMSMAEGLFQLRPKKTTSSSAKVTGKLEKCRRVQMTFWSSKPNSSNFFPKSRSREHKFIYRISRAECTRKATFCRVSKNAT